MTQSHPPIPQPQPGAPDDGPRTQSILLPPSQRQPDDVAAPSPAPSPAATGHIPQPPTGAFPPPGHDPGAGSFPQHGTGSVDFVPGFEDRPRGSTAAPPRTAGPVTSPGNPPPGSPTGKRSRPRRLPFAAAQRTGRGGTALLSLGLGLLALLCLQLGLALDYGSQSLWDVVPTWSAFATLGAVLVLVPAVGAMTGRLRARTAWRIGAGGAAALTAAWVFIALPLAASDRGFWLTAAVAAAGAALWLAPGRSE